MREGGLGGSERGGGCTTRRGCTAGKERNFNKEGGFGDERREGSGMGGDEGRGRGNNERIWQESEGQGARGKRVDTWGPRGKHAQTIPDVRQI